MKIVKKPWGREVWFAHTKKYAGKLLYIQKGHRLSLQYHKRKDETLYALKGSYLLEMNPVRSPVRNRTGSRRWRLTSNGVNVKKRKMKQGSVIHFPPKTVHRMEARYGDVVLIEVSTPEVEDVVRLEDDYKRTSKAL